MERLRTIVISLCIGRQLLLPLPRVILAHSIDDHTQTSRLTGRGVWGQSAPFLPSTIKIHAYP